jgi:hypothetical protein
VESEPVRQESNTKALVKAQLYITGIIGGTPDLRVYAKEQVRALLSSLPAFDRRVCRTLEGYI